MERWARGPFGAHVRFICACVDAQNVAVAFGQMFQLAAVVNAHIPSREHFPDFGQLGCSGFIVVDQGGRCVSRNVRRPRHVKENRCRAKAHLHGDQQREREEVQNIGEWDCEEQQHAHRVGGQQIGASR